MNFSAKGKNDRLSPTSSSALAEAAQAPFSSRFLGEAVRSSRFPLSTPPSPFEASPSTLVTGRVPLDGSASSLLLQHGGGTKHRVSGQSGRSSRRAQRYQLQEESDTHSHRDTSMGVADTRLQQAEEESGSSGGGGKDETLLGLRRITFEDDDERGNGRLHGSGGSLPGSLGVAPSNKEERFRAVMENSKQHRMEKQRDRSEANAATTALDEAFASLRHLLPMRDKGAEELKAFQESGTPEVRALLKAYKKKRGKVPRMLVIRTKKGTETEPAQEEVYVVPLTNVKEGNTEKTAKKETSQADGSAGHSPSLPQVKLTLDDLQCLEDIRRFGEPKTSTNRSPTSKKSEVLAESLSQKNEGEREKKQSVEIQETPERDDEVEDLDGIAAIEDAKRQFSLGKEKSHVEGSRVSSTTFQDADHDFDRTMQLFMMDTRRARPTQRLLAEEEEEAKRAEEMRLEEDRATIPGLGTQEAVDQIQWTRREWLERGGDLPFQMSHTVGDKDEEDDDGISLSSLEFSEEGSEEEQDDEIELSAIDAGVQGKEKKVEKTTKSPAQRAALSGSTALDSLLSSLEKLVVSAPTSLRNEDDEEEGESSRHHSRGIPGGSDEKEDPRTSRSAMDSAYSHNSDAPPSSSTLSVSQFLKKYQAVIFKMYQFGQKSPLLLANTFRLIIMEAERVSLRGRVPSPSLGALLVACTQLFPMTDYRHPVSLPLLLYLGSAVFQLRLQSRQHVKGLVFFAALLTRCVVLSDGKKFVPEAIIAVLNVLALQLPLYSLVRDGSRYQGLTVSFPLVERPRLPCTPSKEMTKLGSREEVDAMTAEERRAEMQDQSLYLPVLCCRGVEDMVESKSFSARKEKSERDEELKNKKKANNEEHPDALTREIRVKSKVRLLSLLANEKKEENEQKMNASVPSSRNSRSNFLVSTVYIPEKILFSHENWEERVTEDEQLLCVGYSLLLQLAEAYKDVAAFSVILKEPMEKLHHLLQGTTASQAKEDEEQEEATGDIPTIKNGNTSTGNRPLRRHAVSSTDGIFQWRPSPVICALHQRVRERLAALAEEQIPKRTPLAMRTFRPRPLRLFDPLLEEREEIAVKSEVRELKKTLREDRKRVMRHVQAEATVTKRQREAEQTLQEQERQKAYNRVLGQLQAQQHIMNTVDAAMERGRKKVRKGMSAAPKSAGDGVPEY